MDFFGIGWLELFFILIIVLLVAGPKDIERGAKGLGRTINKLNRSPSFQAIRRASTELRNLPQRLAKEANLEELKELSQEVKQVTQEVQQVQQDVQQVRQELKENTSNITGAHKTFQAWVQELPAENGTPPPALPPPPASGAGSAAPAAEPTTPNTPNAQ
jgi:Sec-independent protein translocase protein TatA